MDFASLIRAQSIMSCRDVVESTDAKPTTVQPETKISAQEEGS